MGLPGFVCGGSGTPRIDQGATESCLTWGSFLNGFSAAPGIRENSW
jgi:hypothetical protein